MESVVSAHTYGIIVQLLGLARSINRDALFQTADVQNNPMGVGLEASHDCFKTTESGLLPNTSDSFLLKQ